MDPRIVEKPQSSPATGHAASRGPLRLAAVLLVLAAMAVAYSLGARSTLRPGAVAPVEPVEPEGPREPAPAFTLPSLRGSEQISLSDFPGQVVVINFFASWCAPCALEAADLERTWQAVKGSGVVFVGIAIQDQYQDAKAFVTRHDLTYSAAFDVSGEVMQAYRITGIPTTVFIDPAGRIAGRHAGTFVGDEGVARLRARIEATRRPPR